MARTGWWRQLLPSRLEWRIARRYLRSRRGSRTASLNTVISTGGVAVGVLALIVVLGIGARAAAQTSDDLFNPDVLQRVDLWLNSADWAKLKAAFQENTYYGKSLSSGSKSSPPTLP